MLSQQEEYDIPALQPHLFVCSNMKFNRLWQNSRSMNYLEFGIYVTYQVKREKGKKFQISVNI